MNTPAADQIFAAPPGAPDRAHFPAAQSVQPLRMKNILVPTDFSEPSEKAVRYAQCLAQQFHAHLVLLHVMDQPNYAWGPPEYPSLYLTAEYIDREYQRVRREVEDNLAQLHSDLASRELKTESVILTGTPYDQIIGLAKRREIDLIVIATHGYTGLKHVLLGSTAERVVRHAPCPVFVVREQEHDSLLQAQESVSD
jgi:universal stress protein A